MRREIMKEMIACAKCRLREALRAMKIAPPTHQIWMHDAIIKELVCRHPTMLFVIMMDRWNYSILP